MSFETITWLLHARQYTVLVFCSPLLPPGSEVDFEPVVPVLKSRDNSGKLSLIIESMPPAGRWLVELWVGVMVASYLLSSYLIGVSILSYHGAHLISYLIYGCGLVSS